MKGKKTQVHKFGEEVGEGEGLGGVAVGGKVTLDGVSNGSRWGLISFDEMSNLLKVDKKGMSIKVLWSINTFFTSQFAIPIVITIGSSYTRSTRAKSSSMNVIGGSDFLMCGSP